MIDQLRSGDVVKGWKLDQLSRSLKDIFICSKSWLMSKIGF